MVEGDPVAPLPWLERPLAQALATRTAHALLVHGPQGVGQFEFAVTLAQAWLCESPEAAPARHRPCGGCPSCRLVLSRSHPDLLVVLPEALRESLGWSQDAGDESGSDRSGKTKPSKEIKVEAVRSVVAFAQMTSARGRAKVVVVHPAERMNTIAANTLLKTLEEPAGDARFVLSCAAPDALLPTIRSRCQSLPLTVPETGQALQWLAGKGVARPEVLLAATGGQPLVALEWATEGLDAESWLALPRRVSRGEIYTLLGWPLPRLVDTLQKICHDAFCVKAGAAPRYFPAPFAIPAVDLHAASHWARALSLAARSSEHPWHAALMAESLLLQARQALACGVVMAGAAR